VFWIVTNNCIECVIRILLQKHNRINNSTIYDENDINLFKYIPDSDYLQKNPHKEMSPH
jgi:hypothetical protein